MQKYLIIGLLSLGFMGSSQNSLAADWSPTMIEFKRLETLRDETEANVEITQNKLKLGKLYLFMPKKDSPDLTDEQKTELEAKLKTLESDLKAQNMAVMNYYLDNRKVIDAEEQALKDGIKVNEAPADVDNKALKDNKK